MTILIKNQRIKVSPSDLPILIYHKDKVYYIKHSRKCDGIYINTEKQNKEIT